MSTERRPAAVTHVRRMTRVRSVVAAGDRSRKICEILGLSPNTASAAAGLKVIEDWLCESRKCERTEADHLKWAAKAIGRPSLGIGKWHDVQFLAHVYEYCTGVEARATRVRHGSERRDKNRFYEFVQLCLHQADPAALIRWALGPGWRHHWTAAYLAGRDRELALSLAASTWGLDFAEALKNAGLSHPPLSQK